jgi:hypothetical protein
VLGGDPCNSTANALTIQAACRSEYTVYENARVALDLRIGYPNRISPYMKSLVSRMQVLGYINDIVIVRLFFGLLTCYAINFIIFCDAFRHPTCL